MNTAVSILIVMMMAIVSGVLAQQDRGSSMAWAGNKDPATGEVMTENTQYCDVGGFRIPWLPLAECGRLEVLYKHVLLEDPTERIVKALAIFRQIEELADRHRPKEPLSFPKVKLM